VKRVYFSAVVQSITPAVISWPDKLRKAD